MENLNNIQGIVLLEKCDRHIMANYNQASGLGSLDRQTEFERNIILLLNNLYRACEGESHILSAQGFLILVHAFSDFYLIVIADPLENEVILAELLGAIQSGIAHFCGKDQSAKMIYKYYTEIAILLNEVFDGGMILTTNHDELIARILMQERKTSKTTSTSSGKGGVMSFFNFS